MLARPGSIPARGQWAFEVKWDGFRALVRKEGEFQVRSRRGWNMTELVRAGGDAGARASSTASSSVSTATADPDFPAVCHQILNGDASFALTFVVFDVLALDGQVTMALPHAERRGCSTRSGSATSVGTSHPRSMTRSRSGTSCSSASTRASWRSG
jgi:bifunctional non-homologous end joining protein LigD